MADPYVEFFLNSKSVIVQYETVEISHPNFSKVYRAVRNNTSGLLAKLETSEQVFFEYYPLRVSQGTTEDNLDYTLKLDFGDLGDVLPFELDLVHNAGGFQTKPALKYRTYRSDQLNAPMLGPIELEITEFSFTKTGATFEAKAPMINLHKTGEVYSIDRFHMLKGFL